MRIEYMLSGTNGVIFLSLFLLQCYLSYNIDMSRARDCEAGLLTFGSIYYFHAVVSVFVVYIALFPGGAAELITPIVRFSMIGP